MTVFYKRQVKVSDFQKVVDTGQINLEFLLDEKISFQILLTQNIEDIGFYESETNNKRLISGNFNINNFIGK